MKVTIEPHLEKRLKEVAKRRGCSPEEAVIILLEEKIYGKEDA